MSETDSSTTVEAWLRATQGVPLHQLRETMLQRLTRYDLSLDDEAVDRAMRDAGRKMTQGGHDER